MFCKLLAMKVLHLFKSFTKCVSKQGSYALVNLLLAGLLQGLLLESSEAVSYNPDAEKPWHYVWIGFDGNLSEYFKSAPDVGVLTDAQPILDVMHAEDGNSRCEEFLASKLFMLYYGFLCNTKDEPSYTRRVKNFIKSNYSTDLSVEDIASRLGVNRIYLSRIFKEDYGISIKQYIVSVRMPLQ